MRNEFATWIYIHCSLGVISSGGSFYFKISFLWKNVQIKILKSKF